MKIIITESQLKKLTENKVERTKNLIRQKANEDGIMDTSRMLGMDYKDFINKFEIPFDDEKAKKLIKNYIDDKLDIVYNFEKDKDFYCEQYETPDKFLNVVEDAILDFLYYNHFQDILDDDSVEFENVVFLVSNYLIENYGDIIKNKFIENCKK